MEKWENETGLVTAVIFSNPGISQISLKDSFQNWKKNLENTSKSELLLKCCFSPEYQTTAVSLLNNGKASGARKLLKSARLV